MRDPIVPRDNTEALAAMLPSYGAETELFWHHGGHELGQDDLNAAKQWLSARIAQWHNRDRSAPKNT
jgi:predicted esterase